MKSQTNTQSRPVLNKKPSTKALNQKKNSILLESTLKKQKSKPNLYVNTHHQSTQNTTTSNVQKLTSPKNTLNNHSISMLVTTKTEPNQDFIKPQKSQLHKKTLPIMNKVRKTALSKNQPIKKQFLSNLRSPKNLKPNVVQSQIFLTEKQHCQNGESLLNIQLDTSIIKTQHFQDQNSQNNHESQVQISFLKQNSTKTILTLQQSQIQELTKTSKQQNEQILRLKGLNEEMQRKLNKMKSVQDEHKKKLRERISTFNEQGEEIKQLKEKIMGLEKQIESLLKENNELKNSKVQDQTKVFTQAINKQQRVFQAIVERLQEQDRKGKNIEYKIFNLLSLHILPQKRIVQKEKQKKGIMIDESVMTSFDDSSLCDGVLSFINGNSSVNLQESLLSNEKPKNLSSQFMASLQIETIKNTYDQKYKQKIQVIENKYNQGLKDIQSRVKLFQTESQEVIKNQQREIILLQKKIDDLYQKIQDINIYESTKKKGPSISIDQSQLKHMMEVNSYKKKLTQKDEELKTTRQQIHVKEIQCKRISAQLDIQRIKHSLNSEISILNKQIIKESQNQQIQIIIEELKLQKQKNHKLSSQNQKKQELIKKLSSLHQNNINKKIKK